MTSIAPLMEQHVGSSMAAAGRHSLAFTAIKRAA